MSNKHTPLPKPDIPEQFLKFKKGITTTPFNNEENVDDDKKNNFLDDSDSQIVSVRNFNFIYYRN